MNEQEFQHNLAGAKTFHGLSPEQYDGSVDFWAGYIRGLRRNYHGEGFGTEQEHKIWMSFLDSLDLTYKMRTLGYIAGFEGMDISMAIKTLEQELKKQEAENA